MAAISKSSSNSSLRTRALMFLLLLPFCIALLSALLLFRCLDPSGTLEAREALAGRERFIQDIEHFQKKTGRDDVIVITNDGTFSGSQEELNKLRNALKNKRALFDIYQDFAIPTAGLTLLFALGALGAGAFAIGRIERRPRSLETARPLPPRVGPLVRGVSLPSSLMLIFLCAHLALSAMYGPFITGEVRSVQGFFAAACAVAALFIFLGTLRLFTGPAPLREEKTEEKEEQVVFGQRLQPEEAPALFAFVGENAAKARIAPPDNIVIGDDEQIFALRDLMAPSDEDSPLKGLSLYLSLPVLAYLTRDEAGAAIAQALALASAPGERYKTPDPFPELSAWERKLGRRLFFKPARSLLAYFKARLAEEPGSIRQQWHREIEALKAGARIAGSQRMAFVLAKLAAITPLAQAASFDSAGRGGADGGAKALLREAVERRSVEEWDNWAESFMREFQDMGSLATLPDGSSVQAPSPAALLMQGLGVSVDKGMARRAASLRLTPLLHELGLTGQAPEQEAPLTPQPQAEQPFSQEEQPFSQEEQPLATAELKAGAALSSASALSRKTVYKGGSLLEDCAARDVTSLHELAERRLPPISFRPGGLLGSLVLAAVAAMFIIPNLDPPSSEHIVLSYLFLILGACLALMCVVGALLTLRVYITLSSEGFLLPGMPRPVPWNKVTSLGIGSAGNTGLVMMGTIITIGVEPGFLKSFSIKPNRRVYCDAKRGMLQTHVGEFSKRQSAKFFIDTFNACRCAALAREKLGLPHQAE